MSVWKATLLIAFTLASAVLGSFLNSTHYEDCSCRNCVEGILRSGGPCQGLRECVKNSANKCTYKHDPCIQRILDSGERCQSLCSCEADRYTSGNCRDSYECPVVLNPMAIHTSPPGHPLQQGPSLGESKDEVKKQADEETKTRGNYKNEGKINDDAVLPVREAENETDSTSPWNVTTASPNKLDCSCQACVENILVHGDRCQSLRGCVQASQCSYTNDPCISAILDSGAGCQSLCGCEASRYPSGDCRDTYTCPDIQSHYVKKSIKWKHQYQCINGGTCTFSYTSGLQWQNSKVVTTTDKFGFSATDEEGFLFDDVKLTVSYEHSISDAVGQTSTNTTQSSFTITCPGEGSWDVYSAYATGETEGGDTIEGVPADLSFICVKAGESPPTCPPGCCTNSACSRPCKSEGHPCLSEQQ